MVSISPKNIETCRTSASSRGRETMSKRLAFLEKLTRDGSDDPMAWYGLAMEYKVLERWDEALQTFTTLRARKPDYVPMYLMCGQMLIDRGRTDDARDW